MSLGGIIGAVVGGVIGFFVGGPWGAFYGAVLGYGIGSYIDPVAQDSNLGGPEPVSFTPCQEGSVIPDLVGMSSFKGNIIFKCCDRVEDITEEAGKGMGGQEYVTGHRYYYTWMISLCVGPVTELLTIYEGTGDNTRCVYGIENDVVGLECPAGGMETVYLNEIGNMDFYFGTNNQTSSTYANVVNNTKVDIDNDSVLENVNIPYRNLCWALFKDCYIGDFNRIPSLRFTLKKTPDIAVLTSAYKVINNYDYNPAFAVYYILNTLQGMPASWLDTTSFDACAATLATEMIGGIAGLGVSINFNRSASARSYIESIFHHIGGCIRFENDGKLHMKLFRGTDNPANFKTIDDTNLLAEPEFSRSTW